MNRIAIVAAIALTLAACCPSAPVEDVDQKESRPAAAAEAPPAEQAAKPPREAIIGSWAIDYDATVEELGKDLGEKQRKAFKEMTAAGGGVVIEPGSWTWHFPLMNGADEYEVVRETSTSVVVNAGDEDTDFELTVTGDRLKIVGVDKAGKRSPQGFILRRGEFALLDVPKLVGFTKGRAEKVLGKPSECWKEGRRAEVCFFRDESLKVTFIDQKADRFLFKREWGLMPSADALPRLGIKKPGEPSFSNDFSRRWEHHDGFREILVEGAGDTATKILIKAHHGDEVFK